MRTWNWILVIVAAFLLGGVAGYQFNNDLVARRARLFAESTPAERTARIAQRMADRLSLTDAQRDQIAAVMLAYDARFAAIREARHADVDAVRVEMDKEIDALLTPEQAAAHAALLAELRATPPPRRPPPSR